MQNLAIISKLPISFDFDDLIQYDFGNEFQIKDVLLYKL